MVAMCSREQASSLCSRDLGECSGGVPGGVGVAGPLSRPAAQCCSSSGASLEHLLLGGLSFHVMHRTWQRLLLMRQLSVTAPPLPSTFTGAM